jgi:hypothetical protein
MAENLAVHNPAAALGLAQNLPPEAQQQIVFSATKSWATADPIGAGRWVDTLAPGPAKEKAISGVSTGLYKTDPAGAFRWAAKLSDPTEQVHHLQATYHEWLFSDAPGARAALMAAGLSPEQIKAVQADPNQDSPETREKNELAIPLDGGIPSPTPNPK